MHILFKVLVDKNDTISTPNFLQEEVDLFLNLGIKQFAKDRYSGNNSKHTSFEQTEKRKSDLKNLICRTIITNGEKLDAFRPNHRFFALPENGTDKYWMSLAEQIKLVAKNCNSKNIINGEVLVTGTYYVLTEGSTSYNGTNYSSPDIILGNGNTITLTSGTVLTKGTLTQANVLPITLDKLANAVRDPFNKPGIDCLLRLTSTGYSEIIGNNELIPYIYELVYIKQPVEVSLANNISCDLSDLTHEEIVRIAVQIALEPIESRRYATMQNEINKQE